MKFISSLLAPLIVMLLAPVAFAQFDEMEIQTADREPAEVRLREAEVRRTARDRSYPGGLDEGNLEVQTRLVAPHPEKTIKQIQAEFFED